MTDESKPEANEPIGSTDQPDAPIFESKEKHDDAIEHGQQSCESGGCPYKGNTYAYGTRLCINGTYHQCGTFGWYDTKYSC